MRQPCAIISAIGGRRLVLSPAFWGAEPRYADDGPYAGIRLFDDEERDGLQFMRMLSPEQQKIAIVAHSIIGGDLPPGRRHFADNLHLGGAFQDNRAVPYEGINAGAMSPAQRGVLMQLVRLFLSALPEGPLASRLIEVERHLGTTFFCWIGGTGDDSPFYYRIQSPVVFIEFDHHAGVFLTNPQPAKFHAHVIVGTPNGNDYGFDLLRRHREANDTSWRLKRARRRGPRMSDIFPQPGNCLGARYWLAADAIRVESVLATNSLAAAVEISTIAPIATPQNRLLVKRITESPKADSLVDDPDRGRHQKGRW
jgi:Protein of unknown function (DUF3500)